jgi:hypothetical protein
MLEKLILIIDTKKDFLRIQGISKKNNLNINFINASTEKNACEILNQLLLTKKLPNLIFIDINIFKEASVFLKLLNENKKFQIIPLIVFGESNLDIKNIDNNYNCLLPKPSNEKEFEKVILSIFYFWFKIAKLPT